MTYEYRGFHISDHMMGGIERYIKHGTIPGNFLQAIICNDLKQAVAHADDENLQNLPAYVGYFYNQAPMICWGSNENMISWANRFKPKPPTGYTAEELERDSPYNQWLSDPSLDSNER